MKEMEYFKKEIKEQFSRDIKKEVSDQINRNSFVRSYLKSKKNIEYAKSRKNKFFPNSEKDVLSVSSIKP
jgi:homoserine trans-succinylase